MNETADDDLQLVAYLDKQLDDAARAALEARLACEPDLRRRLDEMSIAAPTLNLAFDALLAQAPVAKLRARLDATLIGAPPQRRRGPRAWRLAAAAAIATLLFVGGFAAARFFAEPAVPVADEASESWRQAIADYMTLYTARTFGASPASTLPDDLVALGEQVGVVLDVARLSVVGVSLRRAELLQFHGAALVQIGYVEGETPIALCIVGERQGDAPLTAENLRGFATASWAKDGRGFMVMSGAGSAHRGVGARAARAPLRGCARGASGVGRVMAFAAELGKRASRSASWPAMSRPPTS